MSLDREQIFNEALSLPDADRAELADRLHASLGDDVDPEIEAAWLAEIERRIDAVDRGEIEMMTLDEFRRRMRERFPS